MHPIVKETLDKYPSKGTGVVTLLPKTGRIGFRQWFSVEDKTMVGEDGDEFVIAPPQRLSFDLGNPTEKAQFAFIASHPLVTGKSGLSKKAIVSCEEAEAAKENEEADLLVEAFTKIKGLSADELIDYAIFYMPASGNHRKESSDVLRRKLNGIAKNDPKSFLERANDQYMTIRITIRKGVAKGLISNHGGVYKFGENILGSSEDAVVAYFSEQTKLYISIKKEIDNRA